MLSPRPIDTPGGPDKAPAEKVFAQMAAQIPLGRLGRPDEIPRTAVFRASDEASFINGVDIQVTAAGHKFNHAKLGNARWIENRAAGEH